jgi:hypothetical protein
MRRLYRTITPAQYLKFLSEGKSASREKTIESLTVLLATNADLLARFEQRPADIVDLIPDRSDDALPKALPGVFEKYRGDPNALIFKLQRGNKPTLIHAYLVEEDSGNWLTWILKELRGKSVGQRQPNGVGDRASDKRKATANALIGHLKQYLTDNAL